MQAAINAAGNLLPSDLPAPPIYAKVNPADAPILTLGADLEDPAADRRSRTSPTPAWRRRSRSCPASAWSASAAASGPAVRIQANPRALAAYGLNIDDLRTTIGNANVNTPKGNFDGPTRAYTINANDQITRRRRLRRSLIVAYKNGAPVRLTRRRRRRRRRRERQARRLGRTRRRRSSSTSSASPAPTSSQVVDSIKALLPQLQATLPAGDRRRRR